MRAFRMALAAAAGMAGMLGSWSAQANCEHPAAVHFAPGASAADLTGGVPRGDRDCYTIGANAGQHMLVTQTPGPDDNIVFQIYRPHWKISHDDDNGFDFAGVALPGAGDGDDAQKWSGTLPESGTYLLVIGTSAGGGPYRLRIEIR